ncbi:TetR/AcrR family transcriptional regulator [Sedimenticola hydrogenitrophicus]|uniref:TetR/AcrR family transcriptional regulator n=1 Tax=Sedimenticola hydrogenitrophicus TaxID=2967975 RepID=UPI0023AF80BE|nr:TetR/AcrR family transcriptional regulator [Sedimenticola hydrogenitrophicus]
MTPTQTPDITHPARSEERLSSGGQAVLDVAAGLFAEKGYDATSMSEVARGAGVSKANVFHHFRSKHQLYLEVIREACRDSSAALRQGRVSGSTVTEQLSAFLAHHLDTLLRREQVSRLVVREVMESSPEGGKELAEQVFFEGFSELVAIVREGQESGEFRRDLDPALLAHLIISTNVFFFQSRNVLRHFPFVDFADDPRRFVKMAGDLLFHGCLTAPSAEASSGTVGHPSLPVNPQEKVHD